MEYQLYLRDLRTRVPWLGSDLRDHPAPTPSSCNKPASVTMKTRQSATGTLRIPALSSQPACTHSSQTQSAPEGRQQDVAQPLAQTLLMHFETLLFYTKNSPRKDMLGKKLFIFLTSDIHTHSQPSAWERSYFERC